MFAVMTLERIAVAALIAGAALLFATSATESVGDKLVNPLAEVLRVK